MNRIFLQECSLALSSLEEVEAEVIRYFDTLFQGRHTATSEQPEPFDSSKPFQLQFNNFDTFTPAMPTASEFQKEEMELPVNVTELEAAAATAATGKTPGLDGLPYEFYKVVMPLMGQHLTNALNTMLERGLLTASLRAGAVRLIPKVSGAPTVAQLIPLIPITLLACDYKLLTKVFVARLIPLLPTVLTTSQLCSVQGRSIFDGCTAILSAVEACNRDQRPGDLFNMNFFHAYDRVCLEYVDKVLPKMNFGPVFRATVATLQRGATACFLL
jgi:hypothetical protein